MLYRIEPSSYFSSVVYRSTLFEFRNIIFETFEFVNIFAGVEMLYFFNYYLTESLSFDYVFGVILTSYMHLFSLDTELPKVPPI